jgi:hypothetical protein
MACSADPPAPTPSPRDPSSAPASAPPTNQPPPTTPSGGLVIEVPDSIDSTGASDASAQLEAFIESVADGTTIALAAGGTYRLDDGLLLAERSGLTIEGNGATLSATASTGEPRTSPFQLQGGSNLTIRNMTLLGSNPDAGTVDSHHLDRQNQGGVAAYGVEALLVDGVTIRGTWGDCLYAGADGERWSDGITFRDSTCEANGRMGVAIIAASNVLVERVHFDEIAMFPFDIEPDSDTHGATGVTFRDNTVGTYGHSNLFKPYFFAAEGAAGAVIRDVTVTRNTVTGGTLASTADRPNRFDFTFTDNVSLVPAHGPVLRFAAVEGLTVSGNDQPLASGQLLGGPTTGLSQRVVIVAGLAVAATAGAGIIAVRRYRARRRARTGTDTGAP